MRAYGSGLENHNHGAFTPTAEEFLRVLGQ